MRHWLAGQTQETEGVPWVSPFSRPPEGAKGALGQREQWGLGTQTCPGEKGMWVSLVRARRGCGGLED